jgi:uncharacterized protein (TIGR00725 family)
MEKRGRRKTVIGVMGGADVPADVIDVAYALGAAIAAKGWILLNGGRDAGVMRASSRGAKSENGEVIGVLQGGSKADANPYVDIAIATGMGDARNLINVLSSDVVIACRGSAGTFSEIALALKNGKPVVLCRFDCRAIFDSYVRSGLLVYADSVYECIRHVEKMLAEMDF